MAPRFEKAASMFQTIKFVKVNVDEAEALKTEFHLTSIPTFIFLTNGAEIHRFSGALTEDSFTSLITKKFALTSD